MGREQIEAALRREAEPLSTHALVAAGGAVRLSLPGSAPATLTPIEGSNALQIVNTIETYTMACFLYRERKDVGTVLQIFEKDTLGRSADRYAFDLLQGHHVDGRPYLLAAANYSATTDGRVVIGDVKLAAGVFNHATFVCVMDAPGYRNTFADAFRTALGSLDTPETRGAEVPAYQEITIMTLGTAAASFTHAIETLEGKQRRVVKYDAGVMRGQDGHLSVDDDVSVTTYENGVVTESRDVSGKNGETESDITLHAEGRGRYTVRGTLQGKQHSAEFTVQGGIPDDASDNRRILELMRAAPGTTIQLVGFVPSIDPSAPITQVITREANPTYPLRMTMGQMQALARPSASGRMEAIQVALGTVMMNQEVVWQRGTP